MNEKALIKKCQSGDRLAFDTVSVIQKGSAFMFNRFGWHVWQLVQVCAVIATALIGISQIKEKVGLIRKPHRP